MSNLIGYKQGDEMVGAALGTRLTIGLGIGTSGVRALLVTGDDCIVASATEDYPLLTPQPGWTEQGSENWYAASCLVLTSPVDDAPAPIEAIGLPGQMHGATFLGADGQVIRPAHLWNDQRTTHECAETEMRMVIRRWRPQKEPIDPPEPKPKARYDALDGRFARLYPALKKLQAFGMMGFTK